MENYQDLQIENSPYLARLSSPFEVGNAKADYRPSQFEFLQPGSASNAVMMAHHWMQRFEASSALMIKRMDHIVSQEKVEAVIRE